MNKNLLIENMKKNQRTARRKSKTQTKIEEQKIVEEFGNCKLNLDIELKKGDFDNLTDFTKLCSCSKELILKF